MVLLLLCLLVPSMARSFNPRMLTLVPSPATILTYHQGPLLTRPLQLQPLWYGTFSPSQHSILSDFLSSLNAPPSNPNPSVALWWKTALAYKDTSKSPVTAHFSLGASFSDPSYSLGKNFTKTGIADLLHRYLANGVLPSLGPHAVYLVLTADDVIVEDFCMNSCGFHSSINVSHAKHRATALPFIWVGNAATQCPGLCAWPYAVPQYGPPNPALVSPNGDVGMDGMVINVATLLAATVTNPFDTGYFQGDPTDPMEAVTACAGMFGKGSYPGYAGNLLVDKASGASYNAQGGNGRRFLLPAMWSPSTLACETVV